MQGIEGHFVITGGTVRFRHARIGNDCLTRPVYPVMEFVPLAAECFRKMQVLVSFPDDLAGLEAEQFAQTAVSAGKTAFPVITAYDFR